MNQQPGISFGPGTGGLSGASPTPAPIHDIIGPLPFFSGSLWVIVAAVAVVTLAGALLWWILSRKKTRILTPSEAALEELLKLRSAVSEGNDLDFGVRVSGVLRRFLGEAFGLAAPRQTTEEFLVSLRGSVRFALPSQDALAEFLHRSDYLKFARGEATMEQRLALIDAAEAFVKRGASPQEEGAVTGPGIAPREQQAGVA